MIQKLPEMLSTVSTYAVRAQKNVKNDSKINSKSNVRIERNKENGSCSTTRVDPKTVIEPHIEPKNSTLGPKKKSRTNPKLSQNQTS